MRIVVAPFRQNINFHENGGQEGKQMTTEKIKPADEQGSAYSRHEVAPFTYGRKSGGPIPKIRIEFQSD